ncbi:DUF5067 domain-containing protein [Bifidobacterium eulemuris]|uniref:DUF5067 domain-containing protein n=1 Tax=Bifidobacterium eulemuris TaxID=1765219 RepID=A0A261G7F4_9BIFI|nr:DUF5067 domain-containing protein [Bifidobacterium eulemuris]OZG67360.1 hypothetical protein BEUL_1451 [Bifidobacterium eulemuris]QOL32937.1 DUF5067 domain-containing protein [Bifidobacterium eulemuris]
MVLFAEHDDYVSPFDTDDAPDYVNPDVEAARISQQVDAEQDQREHIARMRKLQDAASPRPNPADMARDVQTSIRQATKPINRANHWPVWQSKRQSQPHASARSMQRDQAYGSDAKTSQGKRSGYAIAALAVAAVAVISFGETSSIVLTIVALALAIVAIFRTDARSRKSGRVMAVAALVLAVVMLAMQTAILIVKNVSHSDISLTSSGLVTDYDGYEASDEPFTVADHSGTVRDYNGQTYDITIDQAAYGLTDDYDGNPQLIVSFTVTNNADEAWSLNSMAYVDVLQNGVGLDQAYGFENNAATRQLGFADADGGDDIESGQTQTVTMAFNPTDVSSPILVYVSGVNEAVQSAFVFADGQSTGPLTQIDAADMETPPQAGEAEREGMTTMVDYDGLSRISLRFDSVRQGPQDYDGNDTVMLTLTWINETDRPYSLADLGAVDLAQDGHELSRAYISDDLSQGYDEAAMYRLVMPGVPMSVDICYTPTGDDDSFDASFNAYSSFDDMESTLSLE